MSALYIIAGINHFLNSGFYLKMMPDYLPLHLELVYASGIIESALGVFILFQQTRNVSLWLIIAMLIVFFTVHIQMVIDQYDAMGLLFWIAVIRLPLQFVLIRWAYKLRDRGHRPKVT